ncbi:MAG: DUF4157 domain-containing protein [Calothrix sp. C42_A2020_038]|nr:DUF4157 domain-containing protein [Calothrix sp. C42_A2020_038]
MSELISQRLRDRTKIQQKKAVTSTYSQPSLAQKSTQGFGLSSFSPSQSIASSQSHDISRISLRPQAKLTVGQPGDIYEQEADNVAEQVMRMAASETLEFSSPQTAQNSLQRKCAACENEETEEIQRKPTLQRAAESNIQQPNNIESQLSATQGGGSPLPDNVRGFMEPRFGADFSSVRVHTGSAAVQLSRDLGAQAFTYGSDIYFGAGKSPGNNNLTAHELTHVVQQTGGVQTKQLANQTTVQPLFEISSAPEIIQQREVCDDNGVCWEEDENASYPEANVSYPAPNYTPVIPETNASYSTPNDTPVTSEPNALPAISEPSTSAPTPSTPSSQSNGWELFNNPIWNAVTNNAVSGATGLFEAVNSMVPNMPTFTNAFMRLGGVKGWDAVSIMDDALSFPASRLPGVFGPSGSIVGSRLPMGMSRASAALAPLGVVSNAMSFTDAIARPGSWLEKGGDAVSSAAGFFSSAVGTVGLAGAGLEALGATTVGGTLSAGAAGLGPAAAVAGAGAGGYAAGRLMDEGVAGLMNWTGASNALDRWRGISRPEEQHGDYSISGIGANLATSADQGFTSLMRGIGAYDESRPEYTQTLGWLLADNLPSWLQ